MTTDNPPPAPKPLLDQLRETLRAKHDAIRTEDFLDIKSIDSVAAAQS